MLQRDEVSDRNAALMQAAGMLKDLDEMAFLVAFFPPEFSYVSSPFEYRRWCRNKKRDGKAEV